jgi:ribosomal protein S18 acetylase RimI-like enzyme
VLSLLAEISCVAADDDVDVRRQIFLDHLAFDEAAVFVAEDEGEIAGVASLWIRPRLISVEPEGWLAELYVPPARRRRGHARSLVDACVREARRRHCRRLVLETATRREDALAFYDAYGFEHTARRYELQLGS